MPEVAIVEPKHQHSYRLIKARVIACSRSNSRENRDPHRLPREEDSKKGGKLVLHEKSRVVKIVSISEGSKVQNDYL